MDSKKNSQSNVKDEEPAKAGLSPSPCSMSAANQETSSDTEHKASDHSLLRHQPVPITLYFGNCRHSRHNNCFVTTGGKILHIKSQQTWDYLLKSWRHSDDYSHHSGGEKFESFHKFLENNQDVWASLIKE